MAYLSACKRRDVLLLSLNSSSQYILFGSALERKLVRGGCHSVLRFRRWSPAPVARRYKRIDTSRVSGFDGTPHRGGGFAVVSGDAQARAAVATLSFLRQLIG